MLAVRRRISKRGWMREGLVLIERSPVPMTSSNVKELSLENSTSLLTCSSHPKTRSSILQSSNFIGVVSCHNIFLCLARYSSSTSYKIFFDCFPYQNDNLHDNGFFFQIGWLYDLPPRPARGRVRVRLFPRRPVELPRRGGRRGGGGAAEGGRGAEVRRGGREEGGQDGKVQGGGSGGGGGGDDVRGELLLLSGLLLREHKYGLR